MLRKHAMNTARKYWPITGAVLFALIVGVVAGQGCASKKAAWVTANEGFNLTLERFIQSAREQDPETRAEWKAVMQPKFEAADAALDAWGGAIRAGEAGWDRKQELNDAIDEILDALFELYQGGVP